ncbi:MAG: hypothetical protein JXA14_13900 [Anaerolineae bacterium]|nr:hypothetical protein [Anaerolineae bacterium]
MDALQTIGEAIHLGATWLANGALVTLFFLADHVLPLLAAPAFFLLAAGGPRLRGAYRPAPTPPAQRPYVLTVAVLGLLATTLIPIPIPILVLLMTWGGVIAVAAEPFNPDGLRWRVIGGLTIYTLAALGWTAYSVYVARLSPQAWANLFASDEAAATIAQGRSFLNTISTWGLWGVMPIGYFSLLLQAFLTHPPLPGGREPGALMHTVRSGGQTEAGEAQPFLPWWPYTGE